MTTVEFKIESSLYYKEIKISSITPGWSQVLKDGKWVNHTYDNYEETILTIGKVFNTDEEIATFTKTKFFKNLFKLVQKEYSKN